MKLKTENRKLRTVMRCEKFEPMASAYLDQELTPIELNEFRSHLDVCSLCRQHLQELEKTSLFFKKVPRPEVPRELHSYVMTALESRTSGELSLRQSFSEWMLTLNPRPFSVATGVIVSLILFAFTLSGFKPLPAHAADSVLNDTAILLAPPPDPVLSPVSEYALYNKDLQKISVTDQYELPRIENTRASMSSFGYLAYQTPGNESMSALVEIDKDGRGTLVHVLDEPKDPMVVEQFWWALHNPTFQPAMVEGQPVATQMVIIMYKVDIYAG
jgi:hypothetical protein